MKTTVARDRGAVRYRGFWWVPTPDPADCDYYIYKCYQYGGRCAICGDHFLFQPYNRVVSPEYGRSCDRSCANVATGLARRAA